ncbi:MAG TPA: hypothetical protein VIX87_09535, partial [Steroidobacteraceae bacterium]
MRTKTGQHGLKIGARLAWRVVMAGGTAAAQLACATAYAQDAATPAPAADQSAAPAPATPTAAPTAAASGPALEEIVVTGVRKSLTDAATAKRTAVNFSDSIFAEDTAKFSDNNVAEALNRA